MTAHEFIGSMTIAMLRLGFEASMGANQNMICFENKKGNKSYLHNHDDHITLQTYKVTNSAHPELSVSNLCYSERVINTFINMVKLKLNLVDSN